MGADWSARRLAGLGACLAAGITALAPIPLAASAQQTGHAATAAPGSSCANPETFNEGAGFNSGAKGLPIVFGGPPVSFKGPATYGWSTAPGYIVCSTRIQLTSGTVAPPSDVLPYPGAAPTGGQYDETSPATTVSQLTITVAKTSLKRGSSCRYPQESSMAETIQFSGPKAHVSVGFVEVSPGTIRLKLKPRKANLVLCPKADIFIQAINAAAEFTGQRLVFIVSVKPHGGLSSAVTLPPGSYIPGQPIDYRFVEAKAFARVAKGKS